MHLERPKKRRKKFGALGFLYESRKLTMLLEMPNKKKKKSERWDFCAN